MSRWVDYGIVPPKPLPDSVEGMLAYLSHALGHACYEAWTLTRIKQTYPSLGDAKKDKPKLFALLLDHALVVEWWQGGRLVSAPGDQAPKAQDVLQRLLRSHHRRFRQIEDGVVRTSQSDELISWLALIDTRTVAGLRTWLTSCTGRFQNTNSATNTLSVVDDASALVLFLKERASGSQHTLRAYIADLRKLIGWCRDRNIGPLSDLTRDNLLSYKQHLAMPYVTTDKTSGEQIKATGASTQARALAVVASLYQYLFETGYLTANPAAGLVSGTHVRTGFAPTRFLSPAILGVCDKVMAAVTTVGDDLIRQRRQAIWALFRYAGIRIAELVWDSQTNFPRIEVDNAGHWVLYVQGKGKKQRAIPLPEIATDAIKAYRVSRGLAASPSQVEAVPLIHGLKGGSLMESGLYSEVKEIFLEVANSFDEEDPARHILVAAASPHWLRHAYARALVVDHNIPLTAAQSLLGHASIQTTAGYAKTDLTQLRDFVEQSFQRASGADS